MHRKYICINLIVDSVKDSDVCMLMIGFVYLISVSKYGRQLRGDPKLNFNFLFHQTFIFIHDIVYCILLYLYIPFI